jgi:tetratricopeptide (TPR) repeat protein
LNDINTFIIKKPKDANGYYERGKIYSKNKDYSNAIDDFMTALIYKPDYAEAYLQMGIAKVQLKYYEEALKDIARAMVYKEDILPFGHYKLASIYALMNNKNRMMYNLNQSFAKRYFTEKINFEDFINDEDFKNYKTDKDFIAFKNKLKSKLK